MDIRQTPVTVMQISMNIHVIIVNVSEDVHTYLCMYLGTFGTHAKTTEWILMSLHNNVAYIRVSVTQVTIRNELPKYNYPT